jgi:putative drug exporter of the RND superfamily
VFAFTMMSMIVSDLRVVGQLGMTIGIGLLVDTLIVRSFMTPSIAAALGRWFWWPLNTFKIVKRNSPEPASDPITAPLPTTHDDVNLARRSAKLSTAMSARDKSEDR